MLFGDLVRISEEVGRTSSRLGKVERLAEGLRRLAPGERAAGVAYLSGELRQGQIGVGWASLRGREGLAAAPALTVSEVDAALERIGRLSGPGSQAARREALSDLFARATPAEARFLRALLPGELRQGAQEGVMLDAVAKAAGVAGSQVRRALMLSGDLLETAAAALEGGAPALAAIGLRVGRPLRPMLAQPASDLAAAIERLGEAAVEPKLDGARIQVHREGGDVAVFTRNLADITERVPEVVEAVLALPVRSAVFDGEAIALRPDGRPHPFQVTAGRFGTRTAVEDMRRSLPLTPFMFDLLHLDGEDLIDRPAGERLAALDDLVPAPLRLPRETVTDAAAAEAFLAQALRAGHEGVMLKGLAEPYAAGRRGRTWMKLKPVHTLDLVVLACEWGHGRRRGTLSNLHLGARAADGGFVMLGKTFKGLTDEMLAWQTRALLALETSRDEHTVHVRPELVVEIAFDGLQASTRYPGGVALRFARVVRHRPDKPASEADTLETVLAIHARAAGAGGEPVTPRRGGCG